MEKISSLEKSSRDEYSRLHDRVVSHLYSEKRWGKFPYGVFHRTSHIEGIFPRSWRSSNQVRRLGALFGRGDISMALFHDPEEHYPNQYEVSWLGIDRNAPGEIALTNPSIRREIAGALRKLKIKNLVYHPISSDGRAHLRRRLFDSAIREYQSSLGTPLPRIQRPKKVAPSGEPIQKSGFSRRFWGNNNPETPQNTSETVPEPSGGGIRGIISGLLNRRQGRRETLQQQAAVMAAPHQAAAGALKTAAEIASPVASIAGNVVTNAAGNLDALRELVKKVGAKPSDGTWISLGDGLVRHAETGLVGMLVNGASRVAGSAAGISTGDPKSHKAVARLAQAAVHKVSRGLPGGPWMAPWRIAAQLAAAGGKVSPRQFVEQMLKWEADSPTLIGEGSGRFPNGEHRPAWVVRDGPNATPRSGYISNEELARQAIGNVDGVGVYVLPAEVQSKHAGRPIEHIPGASGSQSVFQLSPHEGEETDYEKLDEFFAPKILRDQENAKKRGDQSSIEWNISTKDRRHDEDAKKLEEYKKHKELESQIEFDPETGESIFIDPETGEPDDWAKAQFDYEDGRWRHDLNAGNIPTEIDPNHEGDMLEHIADKHHEGWQQTDQHKDIERDIKRAEQEEAGRRYRAERDQRLREEAEQREAAKHKKDEESRRKWGQYLRGNYATRAALAGGRGIYGPTEQYERSFRSDNMARLEKAVGQSERFYNSHKTKTVLDSITDKPAGEFHHVGNLNFGHHDQQIERPLYSAKFGPDEQMAMQIHPSWDHCVRFARTGESPTSYYVGWLGAMPGSSSTTIDPDVKKQIFDALKKLGVQHFDYDPLGGAGHSQRTRLFYRLQKQYQAALRNETPRPLPPLLPPGVRMPKPPSDSFNRSFGKLNDEYYIGKAVGIQQRKKYQTHFADLMKDIHDKPAGMFHGSPFRGRFVAKFGDDNGMLMQISPWSESSNNSHYSIDWIMAHPNSKTTLMDPDVKKQIFDALYNHGVRTFDWSPAAGPGQSGRIKLFSRLQNQFLQEVKNREAAPVAKSVGGQARTQWLPTTGKLLESVDQLPGGQFHDVPDPWRPSVKTAVAKFGHDNGIVMNIVPNFAQQLLTQARSLKPEKQRLYDQDEQDSPSKPFHYNVEWLGAHPNSTSTVMDPAVKKQMFDALYKYGVRSFSYTPIDSDNRDALRRRRILFNRLQKEFQTEVARREMAQHPVVKAFPFAIWPDVEPFEKAKK